VPTEKRIRKREGRQARLEELARIKRQQQQRRRGILIGIAVVIVVGLAYLVSRGSGHKNNVATTTSTTVPASTTSTAPGPTTTIAAPANVGCPNLNGSSPHYEHFSKYPPTCIDTSKTYTVTFQTDVGTFVAVLNPKAAPKTVNSFVFLAGYHYFDGVTFHRVIPGFVVQGGDPTGTGTGGPGYSLPDELPQAGQYKIGSLAMANNSSPNTGGSQFFIVTGSQGVALSPNYSLFGMVTSGMDVVNKISADGSAGGTPNVLHKMVKVTVAES
jgi:cyclophilin family peptidyl-prolyl cis-trans isomerase